MLEPGRAQHPYMHCFEVLMCRAPVNMIFRVFPYWLALLEVLPTFV